MSAATASGHCWARADSGVSIWSIDEHLERQVAVKVPHRRLVLDPEAAASYLAEARAAAHLDHPNIVPVYDVGSYGRFPVLHRVEVYRGARRWPSGWGARRSGHPTPRRSGW